MSVMERPMPQYSLDNALKHTREGQIVMVHICLYYNLMKTHHNKENFQMQTYRTNFQMPAYSSEE